MNSRIDVLELVQCLASSMIANLPQPICCRLLNKTGFNQISLHSEPQILVDLISPNIQVAMEHAKHAITLKLYVAENQLSLAYFYDDNNIPLSSSELPEKAILDQALPELIGQPIRIKIHSDDKLLKHCFRSFEQNMNIYCVTDTQEENTQQSSWDIEINDLRSVQHKEQAQSPVINNPKITLRSIPQIQNNKSSQDIDLFWPFFDSDLHNILGEMKKLRKPKVLVADDSMPSKMATMVMLEHLGCTVSGASDGIEALELASQHPFDLIFLDEKMPGLFGSDVALQLRDNNGQNQLTPKISLTGITDTDSVSVLYEKGITHHIVKPITKLVLENFLLQWRNN